MQCREWQCFQKRETEEAGFFRKNEKKLAREQRKLSRCQYKEVIIMNCRRKSCTDVMKRSEIKERDYLHKLSASLAESL